MATIEIKHRHTNEVIYSCEAETIKEAVEKAVNEKASLAYANLSFTSLFNANLSEANLSEANLFNANLSEANLFNANLFNANLSEANLSEANLFNANLSEANLPHANLFNANLSEANLSEANLFNADLSRANLSNATFSKTKILGVEIDKAPFFIYGLHYEVIIVPGKIMIGCQLHAVEEWKNFTDEQIIKMDGKDALRFWRENKTKIPPLAE